MVITVDGPAAAGKSTVARRLAQRLGFQYLDTGAMYRALTWKALESGVDMSDPRKLAEVAERARVEMRPDGQEVRVFCDGHDVTRSIRSAEVTENICRLADEPAVRRVLVALQRKLGRGCDLVAEGRDQGTEVFPDADVKFFLDAALEERARRRLKDLREAGNNVSLEDVIRQVAERDAKDCARPVGALRKQDDMILIDSTNMAADDVVETMAIQIERRAAHLSRPRCGRAPSPLHGRQEGGLPGQT